jgi:hypothetical protein
MNLTQIKLLILVMALSFQWNTVGCKLHLETDMDYLTKPMDLERRKNEKYEDEDPESSSRDLLSKKKNLMNEIGKEMFLELKEMWSKLGVKELNILNEKMTINNIQKNKLKKGRILEQKNVERNLDGTGSGGSQGLTSYRRILDGTGSGGSPGLTSYRRILDGTGSGGSPGLTSYRRNLTGSGGSPGLTSYRRILTGSGGSQGLTSYRRNLTGSGGSPGLTSYRRNLTGSGGSQGLTSYRRNILLRI